MKRRSAQFFARVSRMEGERYVYPRDGGLYTPYVLCDECWCRHTPEHRQRRLRRMLPNTVETIIERMPCVYMRIKRPFMMKHGLAVYEEAPRILFRDLHAIGAVKSEEDPQTWELP